MQASLGPFLLGDSSKFDVGVFWHILWGHNQLILSKAEGNQRKESCVAAGRLSKTEMKRGMKRQNG